MANARIRSALLSTDATRDVEVMGIGTTKTGYVIRFRDQQSAEAARTNTDWLVELGNGTKLVENRYGIVVHRMPTDSFPHLGDEKESITNIMEENDLATRGYQIREISWLRQKDKPLGQHGSLGIWFNTPEAAEWMIVTDSLWARDILAVSNHTGSRRRDATDAKGMAIWHGLAKRMRGVDIAQEHMNAETTLQEQDQDAWNAMEITPRETKRVRTPLNRPPHK
jgi:hypothetical protein